MCKEDRAPVEQLPHLIRLLDDETPLVRESVTKALLSLGDEIETEIHKQSIALTDHQRALLDGVLSERSRAWLRTEWDVWRRMPDTMEKLEEGWSLLSAFMEGPSTRGRVTRLLDELAESYRVFDPAPAEPALAEFLFKREGFSGARRAYDAPHNSNLAWVIEKRRGIPISLCCMYMLVAARVGLDVKGCNYPGHFLCRIMIDKTPYVVDCFNGGRILDQDHAPGMTPEISPSIRRMIREAPEPSQIMQRALRNLVRAYDHAGLPAQRVFMEELLSAGT